MVKILSKSGDSLADTYDVEGSVAGIDQLETRELGIIHEMGHTVFSERLSASIRRGTSGAILQSTTWDLTIPDFPVTPFRVLGVVVVADAGRVAFAQVSLQDASGDREIPIWIWDTDNDVQSDIRIVENGAAVANLLALVPSNNGGTVPNLALGSEQPQPVGENVLFRGVTTAFGAGTVTCTALIYIAFSQIGGISSRGLPVPGW